jgi:hypothetical protein
MRARQLISLILLTASCTGQQHEKIITVTGENPAEAFAVRKRLIKE